MGRAYGARHYRADVAEFMVCVNVVAAAVMTGVIWTVQVVHYPLLAAVGLDQARSVAIRHQRLMSWVVGPPMLAEGVATLWLLVDRPDSVARWLPWLSAVLLAVVLASTALVSVPLHAQMASAPTPATGHRLVVTNWPRTALWTMRLAAGALMLGMIV